MSVIQKQSAVEDTFCTSELWHCVRSPEMSPALISILKDKAGYKDPMVERNLHQPGWHQTLARASITSQQGRCSETLRAKKSETKGKAVPGSSSCSVTCSSDDEMAFEHTEHTTAPPNASKCPYAVTGFSLLCQLRSGWHQLRSASAPTKMIRGGVTSTTQTPRVEPGRIGKSAYLIYREFAFLHLQLGKQWS